MQVALSLYCCQNVAIIHILSYYLQRFPAFSVQVANMPTNQKYYKIATRAARASLSTAVPPVGLGTEGAVVHWPDMSRLCRLVDLFRIPTPSWEGTKRQLPPIRQAI